MSDTETIIKGLQAIRRELVDERRAATLNKDVEGIVSQQQKISALDEAIADEIGEVNLADQKRGWQPAGGLDADSNKA